PAGDVDRVAGPFGGRGLAEEWAAAAVEEAADELLVGVVVRRAGVFVHVKAGEPADPAAELRVARVRKALEVEDAEPFRVMEPVEHHGEFLVIHPLPGELDLGRPRRGVLAEVALPGLL